MPPTVTVPESVRLPAVAVTARLPPTLDAAKSSALALTTVASPVGPLVLSATAPVEANPSRIMSSLAFEVVNVLVPPTVNVPTSVMLPVVAVALRLRPTVLPVIKSMPVALTKVASPVAPLVLINMSPVTASPLFKVIVPLAAVVVNDPVPPTVTAPLSAILPVVAVAERLPPIPEVLKSMPVALTIVALPVAPLVLNAILPVTARRFRSMSSSAVDVVNEPVPPTVTVPESVRLPAVAVTARLPPTLDAAKSSALALTTVASPVGPLVLSATAPVEANPSRIMSSLAFEVVNVLVPPTVNVPTSVMLPVVAVALRLRPTVLPVIKSMPVALTKVASPVAPLVLINMSPVTASPLFKVIVPLAAVVVNDPVPPTVTAPLSAILPVVAVAERLPPIPEVLKSMPVALTIVALPVAPLVLNAILPVTARRFRSMSSSAVDVVNEPVPPTVTVPESVRLPAVAVTARLPPTLDAAKSSALALTTVASPVGPLVLSATAPVEANPSRIMSSLAFEVVNVLVPPTVNVPTSVMLPVVAVALRLRPTVLPVIKSMPVALTKVASPVAPLVLINMSPVTASPLFKVIVPLAAVVSK